MSKEILEATTALAREKGIAPDKLFFALEDALLSAYKKTPGAAKYARVEMDREVGDFTVYELLIPERLEAQLIVETIDEGTVIDPETGEAREPEDPEIDPEKFEQYMKGPEGETLTRVAGDPNWVESKRAIVATGLEAPGVASKFRMYDDYLQKMENALQQNTWLAGATFTLADVAMAPMINRIEVLARPEMIAAEQRPRIADWWQRIQARPGFKEAFAFKNPDQSDPVKR